MLPEPSTALDWSALDALVDVGEALWDKVAAANLKDLFRLTALIGTQLAAGSGASIRPR
jgi:hypothetical protein